MSLEAPGIVAHKLHRAYYDSVYRISKAALEPVVDAISDVIRESVADSVKDGIREAITTTDFIGELFLNRWRKK